MKIRFNSEESGQALIEMSFGFIIMCVFVFGAIDFGRAVYDSEVMKNLAGEGSSLGSRGTPILQVQSTVTTYAGSDIDVANNGCIIITTVSNVSGTAEVTAQTPNTLCGVATTSRIGCTIGSAGCRSNTPTLPSGATLALLSEPNGSFLSITEVWYNFSPITPIAGLMRGNLLPSQMYAVAYY
jgi:Flp pilus assembly protein TadG